MSLEEHPVGSFVILLSDEKHHRFILPCKAFETSYFFGSRFSGRWRTSEFKNDEIIHTFYLGIGEGDDAVLLEHEVRRRLLIIDDQANNEKINRMCSLFVVVILTCPYRLFPNPHGPHFVCLVLLPKRSTYGLQSSTKVLTGLGFPYSQMSMHRSKTYLMQPNEHRKTT